MIRFIILSFGWEFIVSEVERNGGNKISKKFYLGERYCYFKEIDVFLKSKFLFSRQKLDLTLKCGKLQLKWKLWKKKNRIFNWKIFYHFQEFLNGLWVLLKKICHFFGLMQNYWFRKMISSFEFMCYWGFFKSIQNLCSERRNGLEVNGTSWKGEIW